MSRKNKTRNVTLTYADSVKKLQKNVGNLIRISGGPIHIFSDNAYTRREKVNMHVILVAAHNVIQKKITHITSAVDSYDYDTLPMIELLWEGKVLNGQFHMDLYDFLETENDDLQIG